MQLWRRSWQRLINKGTRKRRQTKSLTVKERGGTSSGVLPFFCRKADKYMVKNTHTIAQYIICRWIDNHFIGADTELIASDIVKMTDAKGKSILLSLNINNQILDYETREILSR